MSIKINKNGKEYDLGFIPEHYPADRVYLDGDTTKTVQDEFDGFYGVRMYAETRDVVFENSATSKRITVPTALSGKTIYAMIFSSHVGGGGYTVREYHADSFLIQWGSSLNTTVSCDLVWFYS